LGEDFVGYEVGAAGARGEGEGFLEPGHFCFADGFGVVVGAGVDDVSWGIFGWWDGVAGLLGE
jgi:hypothetical protein